MCIIFHNPDDRETQHSSNMLPFNPRCSRVQDILRSSSSVENHKVSTGFSFDFILVLLVPFSWTFSHHFEKQLQALCCHFWPDNVLLWMGVDPNLAWIQNVCETCALHHVLYEEANLHRIIFLAWQDHDDNLMLLIIIIMDATHPAPSESTNVRDGFINNHMWPLRSA